MLKTNVNKNAKGFTLIELLVVIAIIGILAAVVLIALNPIEFLRRSRDTTRLTDLGTLVTATKLFQTNNPSAVLPLGPLCSPAAAATSAERAVNTGWLVGVPLNQGSSSNTIPNLPVDPAASATSRYAYAADANQNFEYSAVLESTTNTTKMSGDGGSDDARYEVGTILRLDTTTASCP